MLDRQMSKPLVKICGLKDTDTIKSMNGLAVDYIGLVFAASKRRVTVEQGKLLVKEIHQLSNGTDKKVKAVAVCVDMPLSELQAMVEQTNIDVVQLHGKEDKAYMEALSQLVPHVKIWKALSVNEIDAIEQQRSQLNDYIALLEAIVIDAPGGGTGTVFNWEAIEGFIHYCKEQQRYLFVAGGLNETNVDQLLEHYAIDGVDVSSGVETDGIKDITKINGFVGKVRKQ